jgi:tetratricopeptide (TPR) repeat protein
MRPMKSSICAAAFMLLAASTVALHAQTPPASAADATELVNQARAAQKKGQLDEALSAYKAAIAKDPKTYEGHLGLGQVLDLQGHYAEARKHFERAIALATPEQLLGARANMATSFAFEGKAAEAAKYYQQNFDAEIAAPRLDNAAGTANSLGRVFLETGDTANAERWYRTGYETAKKLEKASPEDIDLWEMRWHHALGRIAARRGQALEAREHAKHVKEIVDRGRLDKGQVANYPYLLGYIAFYAGDYDTAIAELLKGSQEDPFVVGLIAQAYEKKKDTAKAKEYYAKVLEARGHALQVAFMRPLAQKKLKS